MSVIQLFKYSGIPEKLVKITVSEKTSKSGKYTVYSDEKNARATYSSEDIGGRIKRWILSENLVVLSGAGTSITTDDIGGPLDSGKYKYTGKTVWHIWEKCKKELDDAVIQSLQKELHEPDDDFQLERFISKLEIFISANSKSGTKELQELVKACEETREKIIQILKDECNLSLADTAPHPKFLRDLMAARRDKARMQLYTLNYDTLFEQAAENLSATVIDGFAFARNPVFNGTNFDLDVVKREKNRIQHNENYEEKVFQLYKLHGSLDWRKDKDTQKIVRVQDVSDTRETIFIPPSVHKFEQSYDMPYFEMMSRFQQSLRKENTTLIIIGYSFSDGHINRVIQEALNSNLNFELVVLSPKICGPGDGGLVKELHQLIDNGQNNITLISDTFQRFTRNIPSIISDDKELQRFNNPDDSEIEETPDAIPF